MLYIFNFIGLKRDKAKSVTRHLNRDRMKSKKRSSPDNPKKQKKEQTKQKKSKKNKQKKQKKGSINRRLLLYSN